MLHPIQVHVGQQGFSAGEHGVIAGEDTSKSGVPERQLGTAVLKARREDMTVAIDHHIGWDNYRYQTFDLPTERPDVQM